MRRHLLSAAVAALGLLPIAAHGQCNQPGTVHISAGGNLGIHATKYVETSGGITNRGRDGAISYGFPLKVHVGVVKPLSIGVYGEFGGYVDTAGTRSNRTGVIGIEPRFYPVNTDHFNLRLFMQGGYSMLRIEDRYQFAQVGVARYAGPHFAFGTGLGFYAKKVFGMYFDLKYVRHWLPLRSFEANGQEVDFDAFGYEAELTTHGIQLELGFNVRF
ncbi:MAG: hypothetical protein JNJ64_09935 [Flavobacteriales bacterium]|nr:hypothetical protein [Flavobacteriales bacterium]